MGKSVRRTCKLLLVITPLLALFFWSGMTPPLAAQEGAQGEGDQSIGRLVITSADASSAPTIVLRAYAVDGRGAPVDLSPQNVAITHAGLPVTDIETVGGYDAGTFTIFVVDLPPGVEPQLGAIQQAVEQFTSPPEMQEGTDYVAIYQIGENEAAQLLAPANFYNTIRNFFEDPFASQAGPTALLDSLGALIDETEALKPKADMVTSIVLMTDGTDVVSQQFEANDISLKAGALGIPIHTIWLENENLQPFSHEAGQNYLSDLAQATGGLYSQLDQAEGVQAIWNRIASFRTQETIQYRPENLSSGAHEVVLSLRDDPAARDSTTVTIPESAPSVTIDLPAESRQLTLESLDEPVVLSFSTTVSWLDGVERQVAAAQLLVNGAVSQEIDVRDLDQFRAEITNFSYGPNTVQIAIEDELGQKATSPSITLNINEGETEVPEALAARSGLVDTITRFAVGCFVFLFIIALAVLAVLIIRRMRARPRRGYRPPEEGEAPVPSASGEMVAPRAKKGRPYLEVVESVTRLPPAIELTAAEHRLGRNPSQSDIAFENDITVSRLHASVMLEGSDYRLYDEASSGGTFVNDQPVPEYGYQLLDGDEIRLGAVRLRYRSG